MSSRARSILMSNRARSMTQPCPEALCAKWGESTEVMEWPAAAGHHNCERCRNFRTGGNLAVHCRSWTQPKTAPETRSAKRARMFSDQENLDMRIFNMIVERDPDTGVFVGSVPGWPGAHIQGATLEELEKNLREVIEMLLEDGEPVLESEFVGLKTIRVA